MPTTTLNQNLLQFPADTTANRVASAYTMRMNTSYNQMEYYNGSVWRRLNEPTVFVKFGGNGGATALAYRGAFSSVARNGAGIYTVTFSRAMANANYLWYYNCTTPTLRTGNHTGVINGNSGGYLVFNTTSMRFSTGPYSDKTLADADYIWYAMWEMF